MCCVPVSSDVMRQKQADGDLAACCPCPASAIQRLGEAPLLQEGHMKFQRVEFSWRAAFVGVYLTPDGDKLWVSIIPFLPLYFKRA